MRWLRRATGTRRRARMLPASFCMQLRSARGWRLEAIQTLGRHGLSERKSPTGRLLRDAKLYEIGAGTSEIRRMLIGRELFAETSLERNNCPKWALTAWVRE